MVKSRTIPLVVQHNVLHSCSVIAYSRMLRLTWRCLSRTCTSAFYAGTSGTEDKFRDIDIDTRTNWPGFDSRPCLAIGLTTAAPLSPCRNLEQEFWSPEDFRIQRRCSGQSSSSWSTRGPWRRSPAAGSDSRTSTSRVTGFPPLESSTGLTRWQCHKTSFFFVTPQRGPLG